MKIWQQLIILVVMGLSCQFTIASERPVVALLSDDTESYQQPLNTFQKKINQPVITYNLKGDIKKAPEILDEILQLKPALIFALGAKAAWFAKSSTRKRPDIAVIFAMVLNHQRYQLDDGQVNIAGISSDIAPGTQLFNLSLFSPNIKRIGVVYSQEHSGKTLNKAQYAANILGIKLITKPIKRAKEFMRAWRMMSNKIDAFWVLNDPILYTMDNIYWLKNRCIKERIICTGQSNNMTRLGILLSINPDSNSIGTQASAMANNILYRKRKPADIGIADPIGTHLTLNESTANKIGLIISDEARAIVTEVIRK